jgi:hypothetical protein
MKLAIALLLVAGCTFSRRAKNIKYRPLETGTFARYKIEACASGGHVVKLAVETDEKGEANSRERVDTYKKRYILPALDHDHAIDLDGWAYDNKCAASGLTLQTNTKHQGEALHRIGEVLAKNPTDIEVVVVPGP